MPLWATAQSVAVTTYQYDNHRTGWNNRETQLTPATVSSSKFGLLHTVAIDDRVDAQPLVLPGINVTAGNFHGVHNVVYVVTANNTVYMIDADNGTILFNLNFGTPVSKPNGCNSGKRNAGTSNWILSGQDHGFFTAVSSNATARPIVWALSREHIQSIYLYAFDPHVQKKGIMTQLFQGNAGTWIFPNANANLVPVVANGKVYVASYKQLTIFGLTGQIGNKYV